MSAFLIYVLWDKFRLAHEEGFSGGSMPGAVAISLIAGVTAGEMCWYGFIFGGQTSATHTSLRQLLLRLLAAIFWAAVAFGLVYFGYANGHKADLGYANQDTTFVAASAIATVTAVGVLVHFHLKDRQKP